MKISIVLRFRHTVWLGKIASCVSIFWCQYGVVASQPVCGTLFALKMAPVEDRNVRSMFLTSCLAVIFRLSFNC